MKFTKKITALFLTVVMLVSAMPFNIFTVYAEDSAPTITVDAITATPGSTVSVNVTVKNNPGILGMTLKLSYDDTIATLTNIESGEAMSALTFTKPRDLGSGCQLPFDALDLADEDIKDGTVAILTFEISPKATSADTVNISLSYDKGAIIDRDLNSLSVNLVPGSIQIIDYIPGDVNGDLLVNTTDVIYLRRYIAGGYNVTLNVPAGDVNADSLLNTTDVIYIRRYTAGGYYVNGEPLKLLPSPLAGGVCIHDIEAVDSKAATCTKEGNVAYWRCTKCDTCYSDADGYSRIDVKDTVIAATGHTEVIIPAIAPDYGKYGYTEGIKCSICGYIKVEPQLVPPLEADEVSIQYEYVTIPGDTYLATAIAKAVADNKLIIQETKDTTSSEYKLPFIELNTIKGYEFQGWYTSTADDATKIEVVEKGTVGNVKFFAKWNKTSYTVTYKSDLKALEPTSRTIGETTYLPSAKAMEVPYYIFMGWSDASGRIITEIAPGTENITVYANWTSSTRNKTLAEDYKTQEPIIFEDNDQYLFVYSIGTIDNVPLITIKDYGYSDKLTVTKTEFEEKTFGETEAQTINTTVANATTHSSSWTLSEEWNELITEANGKEDTVSSGTVIAVSDGSSTAYSSEASTYVGNSFHASNSSKVTAKTVTDDSWKTSAEVEAGLSYGPAKVSAKVSGETAHSDHQEDYSESNASLDVKGEWNTSSGYTASGSASHNESRTQSILEEAKNTWKHEISRSIGTTSGSTSEEANSTTESESFTSDISFYSENTAGSSITETRVFDVPGYYRYVMYGKVHVYAAVGYDMKTGSYFVRTYSAVDDTTTFGFDYSADGSYRDYDNGVLPFEVPVFVYNYIYEVASKTKGVLINREGIVTDYIGNAKNVRIPDYATFDNGDGTYFVVPVVGIADGLFENNTTITSVRLGKFITAIPDNAFNGCSALENVEYNELTSIGDYAFNRCTSLKSFEVSTSVTELGEAAFNGAINVTVRAFTNQVATAAVSCGAKTLSVYLDLNGEEFAAFKNKELKTSDDTTEYFAIYGNGKTFSDIRIESNAKKTVINRMTLTENTHTPLIINSPAVDFFAVNIIEAPGIAIHFPADETTVNITGINTISSTGKTAILSKGLTVALPESVSETPGLTVTGGKVLVCGDISALTSFKYLKADIESITEEQYENLLKEHTVYFDANGGTVSSESKTVLWSSEIGELPVPTRKDFTFIGWFNENGTEVTAKTLFTETNDITIRARWQSGWVKASNVPEGAAVNSEKWTYTLREYTSNAASSLSGWTKYDSAITSWGGWSAWSKTAISSSTSRQVETKTVTDREGYTNYRYWIWRSADGNTCGTQGWAGVCYTYDEINLSYPLTLVDSSNGLYGYYPENKNLARNKWFFGEATWVPAVTHTEYRYKDAIYTHYYYRDLSKEAAYDPTGESNVSGVVKWVQYIAK